MNKILLMVLILFISVNYLSSDDLFFRNGQVLRNCLIIDTIGTKIRIQTSEDVRFYPLTTINEIYKNQFDTLKSTIIEDKDGNRVPIWLYKESRLEK